MESFLAFIDDFIQSVIPEIHPKLVNLHEALRSDCAVEYLHLCCKDGINSLLDTEFRDILFLEGSCLDNKAKNSYGQIDFPSSQDSSDDVCKLG